MCINYARARELRRSLSDRDAEAALMMKWKIPHGMQADFMDDYYRKTLEYKTTQLRCRMHNLQVVLLKEFDRNRMKYILAFGAFCGIDAFILFWELAK